MKFFSRKKGFTFNELLVVVLMLGILAAIGSPIYTKAVKKSRASDALHVMSVVSEQQEKYYVEHNDFAKDFKTLKLAIRGFEDISEPIVTKKQGHFEYTLSNENDQACIKANYISSGSQVDYTLYRNYETQNQGCVGQGCKDLISIVAEGSADCSYEPTTPGSCDACREGQHLVGVYPYCQCVDDDITPPPPTDPDPIPCTENVACTAIDSSLYGSGMATCSGTKETEDSACLIASYENCDVSACEPKETCDLECPSSDLKLDKISCSCVCVNNSGAPSWKTNGDTDGLDPVRPCSSGNPPACDGKENVSNYGNYYTCSIPGSGEDVVQSKICGCQEIPKPQKYYAFRCTNKSVEVTIPDISSCCSCYQNTGNENCQAECFQKTKLNYLDSYANIAMTGGEDCRKAVSPGYNQYLTSSVCNKSSDVGNKYIITQNFLSSITVSCVPSMGQTIYINGSLTGYFEDQNIEPENPELNPGGIELNQYNTNCGGYGAIILRGSVKIATCTESNTPISNNCSSSGGGGGGGGGGGCNVSEYERTDVLSGEVSCVTSYNGTDCGEKDGTFETRPGSCY